LSNFDGITEIAAITNRVKLNIAGGRVHELMPDDEQIEKFPATQNGGIKPFVVLRFGTPVRTYSDRTMVGERLQPYRVPLTMGSYASTVGIARQQSAAILNLMLDWEPTTNSSGIITDGGDSFPDKGAGDRPVRFADLIYGSITINMSPDNADSEPPVGIT